MVAVERRMLQDNMLLGSIGPTWTTARIGRATQHPTSQHSTLGRARMFEGILGYIIGGAVIGILARFIKPGADPMGWILTILLGIAGAFIGGYVAPMLGVSNRIVVWVIAIVAAIVLLALYEMVRRKTAKA
jgi:uncharacterized membrane protein YeaQ/YmgE (transglycosylase-associated protein family)